MSDKLRILSVDDNSANQLVIETVFEQLENIIIDYEETPSITFFPLNNKGKKSDDFFAHCLFKDLTSDLSATGKIKLSSLNELEYYKKRNYKSN